MLELYQSPIPARRGAIAMTTTGSEKLTGVYMGSPGYWRVAEGGGLGSWRSLVQYLGETSVGAVVSASGEPLLVVHPPGAVPLGHWFIQTLSACSNLRWSADDLPDTSASCTEWSAVWRLLRLLAAILDKDCPAPSLVPSDTGGVLAEWDHNGLHLEIESDPDGSMDYYASGLGHEREGPLDPLDPDDVAYLKECSKLLLDHTLVGAA